MKIVFLTSSIGFGGAEKMLFFVANSLQRRGNNCMILNLDRAAAYVNTRTQQAEASIPVVTLTHGGHRDTVRQIVRHTREFGGQILVGFTEYPNLYGRLASMMLRIPSVMSERGDPSRTMGKGLATRVSKFLIGGSRGGVFQTPGAMAQYGHGLRKRGTVIPNPIFVNDPVPEVPWELRKKTVVSVGRLDNFQKRYDVMLEAFRIFYATHPDYRLKLWGDGEDAEKIRSWAVEKQIPVDFMGVSARPMADIASDGMFLITSDYEGISNALLEAMAAGLPCVSTDHTPGGARLLISHRENGMLAPVGDCEKLAQAMSTLADDPTLAEKCGENAKKVLTRFAPEKIIDLWEQYLQRLI